MNKLYFGDNLEILREMDDERVHLICTDPPFNSGRDDVLISCTEGLIWYEPPIHPMTDDWSNGLSVTASVAIPMSLILMATVSTRF